MKLRFVFLAAVIAGTVFADDFTIPETLFPIPEKRSFDPEIIKKAEPYLKRTPEQLAALVPQESPGPVLVETKIYMGSGLTGRCPFCGSPGQWFKYDPINDPDRIYCAKTGKDLMSFPIHGEDTLVNYAGKKYKRKYHLTSAIKSGHIPGKLKAYPENYLARERISVLCGGTWRGGIVSHLADAYYATGDEKYATRAIAILEAFAKVLPRYPWRGHFNIKAQPLSEFKEKIKKHDSGYHGWHGPARLGAALTMFRTPIEAEYVNHLARSFMKLEPSKSWNGRKEFIRKNLFREASLLFYAYGAKQCMYNAIGQYVPALNSLGIILKDRYLYGGFLKIVEDFLYNENFYDGISTEGSVSYASMVGGMWGILRDSGLAADKAYLKKNPFLKYAGKTKARMQLLRGGHSIHGDYHPAQYMITNPTPKEKIPGEEFGGYGLSILRAGSPDKRMELVYHHDHITGHGHDDMLGIQLYYRGIPMLEHFGDTRGTVDLTNKIPHADKFKKLNYPAPIVTNDPRPRGFNLQDMTNSLTKNMVIVDEYWAENAWYASRRGGQGTNRNAPYGNLIARTGRVPEMALQYVDAEAEDMNSKSYQGLSLYRRAFAVVTRPDGTPYVVDFYAVSGGHRHLLLFHSRGKEVESTLTRQTPYKHLDSIPDEDTTEVFKATAANIFQPGKVLNNVNLGGPVKDQWKHTWLFDYSAWASKTLPPPKDMLVAPHYFTIHGLLNGGRAKAIRAEGHYPITIKEHFEGKDYSFRFQFENAVKYAGLRAQSKSTLADCYIQCYTAHSDKESALIANVEKIPCDDRGNQFKSAVQITFADGSRDIVIWQPDSVQTSWDAELFSSDARCALIRINNKGKVRYAAMSGGTILSWRNRTLINDGKGTLSGRLEQIRGDISGEPGMSALVLADGKDWQEGTVLKGQTVTVAYNNGWRKDAYTIDRIEKKDGKTIIHLENAPFFIDVRGDVENIPRGARGANQFNGTGTSKGGTQTRYLIGSKIVFPELKKTYTVKAINSQFAVSTLWWTIAEPVNVIKEGIKPGMKFHVIPDWKNAIVELVTTTEKVITK